MPGPLLVLQSGFDQLRVVRGTSLPTRIRLQWFPCCRETERQWELIVSRVGAFLGFKEIPFLRLVSTTLQR